MVPRCSRVHRHVHSVLIKPPSSKLQVSALQMKRLSRFALKLRAAEVSVLGNSLA